MSQSHSRYIPKLSDRDLIRAFQSVASKFANGGPVISFHDALGEVPASDLEPLQKLAGYSLSTVVLRAEGANWQWLRLKVEHNDARAAEYDKLTLSWSRERTPDRLTVAEISAALDAALSRPLASVDPTSAATLTAHSEILTAMESATAQMLEQSAEHRRELDRVYFEKESALVARISEERQRELDRIAEEKGRIEAELETRGTTLDERQRELDVRQKQLDDRNNTHVRREIRSSLLALAKERLANFAVSKQTRTQYLAVHVAAIVGLGALAWGAIVYGARITPDDSGAYAPEVIALAVKSAALAAAAVALGSWYLGWLNRWLQRIADAEFKLQQFRLDIERASWLAETVLEWKSTSAEPFPELLAARLSTGLFSSSAIEPADPKTPASHLAEALFGAAAAAKVKIGDQEVSFDRRSIRGLRREPEE